MRAFGSLFILVALVGCNESLLTNPPGTIKVTPAEFDFGRERVQHQIVDVVTITNDGASDISLSEVTMESAFGAFEVDGTLPSEGKPVVLAPGQNHLIHVRFRPEIVGEFWGKLEIKSNAANASSVLVPISGLSYDVLSESFTQEPGTGSETDVLFVVDNSGSMSDDQSKLAQSFHTFITWLASGLVQYNIAVTSTDMYAASGKGAFVGNPKILTHTTQDIEEKFEKNVKIGINGSPVEKGLEAGRAALSSPMIDTTNAGFLRPNADLFVIFVSDEEDYSAGQVNDYVNFFNGLKGNPDKVTLSAIAGPPPSGCAYAQAGFRYDAATAASGGLFTTICQADFGVALQNLAFRINPPDGEFLLEHWPLVDTITVDVDGQVAPPEHWKYVSERNAIAFADGHIPEDGAFVVVAFETGPRPQ